MYYGNSKNTTFTQSTYNCNAAVGFFMALLMREFYHSAIKTDWAWYIVGMVYCGHGSFLNTRIDLII